MNIAGSQEKRTLTCKFSCADCGLEKIEVEVPVRPVALDVVTWVQQVVTYKVADAHRKRSPTCKAKVIKSLIIPIGDADGNEAPHIGALPQKSSDLKLIRYRDPIKKKDDET